MPIPFSTPSPSIPRRSTPDTPQSPSRLTLTIPEAGERLGLKRRAAYRAAAAGQLPTVRFGRKLLVPLAALDEMLRTARQPGLAGGRP